MRGTGSPAIEVGGKRIGGMVGGIGLSAGCGVCPVGLLLLCLRFFFRIFVAPTAASFFAKLMKLLRRLG